MKWFLARSPVLVSAENYNYNWGFIKTEKQARELSKIVEKVILTLFLKSL